MIEYITSTRKHFGVFEYFNNIIQKAIDNIINSLDITANTRSTNTIIQQYNIELTKNAKHGDIATNAAIVLSREFKLQPHELAERIIKEIRTIIDDKLILKIEIAGSGFINFFCDKRFWQNYLKKSLSISDSLVELNDIRAAHHGIKINIEFCSVNPTGPMHIGHARGTVCGSIISRLLKICGYDVTREFFINDGGKQADIFAYSVWVRYMQLCDNECALCLDNGAYIGEYVIDIAQKMLSRYGNDLIYMKENDRMHIIKSYAIDEMMQNIKTDAASLGAQFDVWTSEQAIIDDNGIKSILDALDAKKLLYRGILERPKSKTDDDWEPREQLLFKSTAFGDDLDRPMLRSDGKHAYFAGDVAYHQNKISRGFDILILILGADHGGYVKRFKAAVAAISDNKVHMDVLITQMVNILRNGEAVRMSKRSGNFITARDVINDCGSDIVRFFLSWKKYDTVLDIDLEKVKEQSKDNPLFYIQYAHTRIVSAIAKAHAHYIINKKELDIVYEEDEDGVTTVLYHMTLDFDVNYAQLTESHEINIIKMLTTWSSVVHSATLSYEPHRIAHYLYELASLVHVAWHRGNENDDMRFVLINEIDVDITKVACQKSKSRARIALLYAAARTLGCGLQKIFEIIPMMRM